jgi:hypothetical protein
VRRERWSKVSFEGNVRGDEDATISVDNLIARAYFVAMQPMLYG